MLLRSATAIKMKDRQAILELQTAAMPLGSDVDVSAIAVQTNGYSGSDLAALCREAGITAMTRNLDTAKHTEVQI